MNILDENIPASQERLLVSHRLIFRQIGQGIGRLGMKDGEIIPLLHSLNRPTFFTLDGDFYDSRLCHRGYCLVHLEVEDEMIAEKIRRLLSYRQLNTKAKRMGLIIRAAPGNLSMWRINMEKESHTLWE